MVATEERPPVTRKPVFDLGKSRRVLIVEDDLDSVHSLVFLLRDLGHRAEYAINGYAALSVARTFKPEIVLVDLGLPGMDGFEFCARLRMEPGLESVRLIAVTAYGQEAYRQRASKVGFQAYFVKPVNPTQLIDLLSQ